MTAPDCGAPATCPVPDPDARGESLACVALPAQSPVWRVYDTARGRSAFNPGCEDTRFAPLPADVAEGSLYGSPYPGVALLETVSHDVHPDLGADRVVYLGDLAGAGLARLSTAGPLPLVDLRDGELARVGLARGQLADTTRAHYPCTRQWARAIIDAHPGAAGLWWRSRQTARADLSAVQRERAGLGAAAADDDVYVFFAGPGRAPTNAAFWPPRPPGVASLTEGRGHAWVIELAEAIDATVE